MRRLYNNQRNIIKKRGKESMKNLKRRGVLSLAVLAILLAQLFGTAVLALGYEAPAEQEIVLEEMTPMAANSCYIYGDPGVPAGAIPIGETEIGNYVSNSFLSYVGGLGYPTDNWDYYMQKYLLPNGSIYKYHIWENSATNDMFYHIR